MKSFAIGIVVAGLLVYGAIAFLSGPTEKQDPSKTKLTGGVQMIDGKQIVIITAKGGYSPQESVVKAGVPTIIRFVTKGTFDCSSSVRISSLDIVRSLPPSGVTDIDVGTLTVGTLQGTCGMGMYRFSVVAE